jgi:hypothetical protein
MRMNFGTRSLVAAAFVGAVLILAVAGRGFAARPAAFTADTVFTGSSLTGWHSEGVAAWKAMNGEVTGSAANGPGWLVSDKSLQDVGFFASFRCAGPCDTGVLIRAQKTAGGKKGIYVSLKPGDLAAYKVTLDAQGKELTRETLRGANGQYRTAPTADADGPGGGRGPGGASGGGGRAGGFAANGASGGRGGRGGGRAGIIPDDWNTIQIVLTQMLCVFR